MSPYRGPTRPLGALYAAVVLLALLPTAAGAVTYVDDALTGPPQGAAPGVTAGRQGGSFGEDGWTVTGDENTIWYVIPEALDTARVEVTVTGLSTGTNLTGALHDLMVIYGTTDRAEPVPYAPYFRSNDFKIQVRVIGTGEPSRGPGANKLEFRWCPMGDPGYHETCDTDCNEVVSSAYLNGAPLAELPWNASRSYRLSVEWEPGSIRYARDANSVTVGYPGTYAPEQLVVRLGSPRHTSGTLNRMPSGLVMSDLLVTGEPSSPTAVCGEGGGGDPPEDCVRGISLDPSGGQGEVAILQATYSHCEGAETFRILQIWVGDEVSVSVPRVSFGFEGGVFGGEAGNCTPGQDVRIGNLWGGLDCANSRVRFEGNEAIVDWAVWFEPDTFAGLHNVYYDAKGGDGDPEPRLGWTQMGTFNVVADPDPVEPAPEPELDLGGTPDLGGPPDLGGQPEVGTDMGVDTSVDQRTAPDGGDLAGEEDSTGVVLTVDPPQQGSLEGGCGCSPDPVDGSGDAALIVLGFGLSRWRRRAR